MIFEKNVRKMNVKGSPGAVSVFVRLELFRFKTYI